MYLTLNYPIHEIPIHLVYLFCSILSFSVKTEKIVIDSIPFSLEYKLLVFKASINDIAIDFAFDLGAPIGLSNSIFLSKTDFILKNETQSIRDKISL
jgi:hypothetical protein